MRGHEPGPWTVKESKSGFPSDVVTVSKNPYGSQTFVAHAYGSLANARLIAAAPDLLEACKASLRQLGLTRGHARLLDLPVETAPQVARLLEAAIAKAEEKTP